MAGKARNSAPALAAVRHDRTNVRGVRGVRIDQVAAFGMVQHRHLTVRAIERRNGLLLLDPLALGLLCLEVRSEVGEVRAAGHDCAT